MIGLELTEPYYVKKEKKWYCVAYINREKAYAQYVNKIEESESLFLNYYEKAQNSEDGFSKIIYYQKAFQTDLLERIEYGNLFAPSHKDDFYKSKEKLLSIPSLIESEKNAMSIYVKINGDINDIIKNCVVNELSKCGFIIANNNSNYTAEILIEPNINGSEPYSVLPSLQLIITTKSGKNIFSYSKRATEKAVAYKIDVAKKRSYTAFCENITNDLSIKFNEKLVIQ